MRACSYLMRDESEPAGPEPPGPDERGGRGGRGEGDASAGARRSDGHGSRLSSPARVAVVVLGPALLTTAYFTVSFSVIGPRHRVLSWVILVGLLTLLALGMIVTTNRTLSDQSGKYRHPGIGILLLSWTSVLVFAASYWSLATRQGQFAGLQTRLDALYFTGVTMATVGYGDIHPTGQLARGTVLVQLVYTFAFLAGGLAALRTRAQARRARRTGGGR